MPKPRQDESHRHEPIIERRRPITQRNMVAPPKPESFVEDDEGFVSRESTIIETKKATNDGRGKRSVKDMLLSMPTDAERATYALKTIARYEDRIAEVLDLCTDGARAMIFQGRKSLERYYSK